MKNKLIIILFLFGLSLGGFAMPAWTQGTYYGSVGYQTVRHLYWYNAVEDVYYDPDRALYYWYDNGRWIYSSEPPAGVYLDPEDWVFFESNATEPYIIHDQIVPYYDSGGYFPLYGSGIVIFDIGRSPYYNNYSYQHYDRDYHRHFHHTFGRYIDRDHNGKWSRNHYSWRNWDRDGSNGHGQNWRSDGNRHWRSDWNRDHGSDWRSDRNRSWRSDGDGGRRHDGDRHSDRGSRSRIDGHRRSDRNSDFRFNRGNLGSFGPSFRTDNPISRTDSTFNRRDSTLNRTDSPITRTDSTFNRTDSPSQFRNRDLSTSPRPEFRSNDRGRFDSRGFDGRTFENRRDFSSGRSEFRGGNRDSFRGDRGSSFRGERNFGSGPSRSSFGARDFNGGSRGSGESFRGGHGGSRGGHDFGGHRGGGSRGGSSRGGHGGGHGSHR